jgi:hypothetical protein
MMPAVTPSRIAGCLYLLIILCGMSAELAFRGPLLSPGTAEGVLAAIEAAPGRLRGAILLDVVMILADVSLAVLLYRLLRHVSETVSLTAMVFRLMQAATIAASLLALVAVDALVLRGDEAMAGLVRGLMEVHGIGYDLGLILFAANTGLTAWLLARSGLVPRPLPWLLAATALVYLAGSVTRIAAPDWNASMQPAYLVALVAETWFALALVFGQRMARARV